MTLRETILGAHDIKSELVHVDEWGVDVEVRGLTAAGRAKVYDAARREDGTVDDMRVHAPLIVAATFDPVTKAPVFVTTDVDALVEKSAAAIDRIVSVALRLSGMGAAAEETIQGNSSGTPSDGSTST